MELETGVAEALADDAPALLDVVANTQGAIHASQYQGGPGERFWRWAIMAVMNGPGDELVDLARTNLLR